METLQQVLRRMVKQHLERQEAKQVADNTQATQQTKQTDGN